jgi:hypothetical protein
MTAILLASFSMVSFALGADLKPPQWGEPRGGLRTRISSDKQQFRAGEPIPIKLEIENIGKEAQEFAVPPVPHFGTLVVLDEAGNRVPFLVGLAQIQQERQKLDAGQSRQLKSCDLAEAYYLRKPGRYTVQLTEGFPSAPFEFEVIANPNASDGDPIGRLLPLIKEHWWLTGGGSGEIQPGRNRPQTTGKIIYLEFSPTGNKRDTGLIWVWLADKQAAEKGDDNSNLPASEYLGKASRWHVYFAATDAAAKAWPTAKDDITKALKAEVK